MTLKHGSIESFYLEGRAGRLEALLNLGIPEARYAALVCHPHPLFGGTMHNKVVFHAMKSLNSFGFPVLRFNFRGVGNSAGTHDYGHGEVDDVRTALDYLSQRYGLPVVFAGFSFGSAIGMRAAAPDTRVPVLAALGLPMQADSRHYTHHELEASPKPKLLLSGQHDEFASVAQLEKFFAGAAQPKRLVIIPEADHFFTGHLDQMRTEFTAWIRETVGEAS